MAEPTVEQVFGAGATRLASGATTPGAGLFIPDSALTAAGLDNPSTATAEGHLASILLTAKTALSQSNFDSNIDQSIVIEDGFANILQRGENLTEYRNDPLTVNLWKPSTGNSRNPNDY
ncbi:hypothetical protein [Nodularia sp. NIES-3585]|uniref:hypothetical protein n=1 Tax=Nodularia sp. NIES-3585 TaxID=1973477 RepID=UPI000B5D0020|nr:hypothetical protein [Nodularia sp. NIES-3585]GAX37883.1 hypothetical protein NIES3585_39280 [Nodularia sp. NIES-3585]